MTGSESTSPFRVLLYSHDSVGLGHIRRNLALAHTLSTQIPAMTGRPVTGMLLTGVAHGTDLDVPDGFDVALLPSICKGDSGYEPRHMQVPMDDLLDIRSQLVKGVVKGLNPDLIIVDRHAYGVSGELRKTLAKTRRKRPGTTIVLGLREVLDEPEVAAAEWERLGDLERFRAIFDEIWVYGDPQVHDVRETGEVPAVLYDMVRYTGYLANGRRWVPETDPTEAPYVLSMSGGGSDGRGMLSLAARATVPAGHRHLVVAGPQMPAEDLAEIQRHAAPGTRVVACVPDGLATIRRASAVVSMAGYNTVNEVMSTDRPVLLVPRERPRQEQLIRARGLKDAGAVDLECLDDLTVERLTAWFAGAVHRTQDRAHLDLAGLAGVAHRVADLARASKKELTSAAL
ncbi:glycosyl transferase family 28 [Ornithinimicrobium sp. F0845]|uniref:glycosyltransferase family protein n=1 Tax=Ornithinimicrobium sp. F0845 TaxID=2926412 RepID=UPI001FF1A5A6|nr:glycosyltransferase [Ornithinimicrobium sp. F0845]MCK0113556.1 glycosyl transferase family 28 [Ornithinimicrobium sp. F0845]